MHISLPSWWQHRTADVIYEMSHVIKTSPAQCLSTGLDSFDEVLCGGLRSGIITELSAAAGSGKTQFCLHIMVQALIQGMLYTMQTNPSDEEPTSHWAVYAIYTEGSFPIARLTEILNAQLQALAAGSREVPKCSGAPPKDADAQGLWVRAAAARLLDCLYIEPVDSPDTLAHVLRSKLARLADLCRVRLVVVDSIGAVFRPMTAGAGAEGTAALSSRTEALFALSAVLRRVAAETHCAVLITNQVTSRPRAAQAAASAGGSDAWGGHGGDAAFASSDGALVPALGLAWSSCVTARLTLRRAPRRVAEELGAPSEAGDVREMLVAFAPHLPGGTAARGHALISRQGLCEVWDWF